ncbi:methyltransferase-domain-containing protein [Apiospora saccharicola]|uniref:Methyltransferase-domain-containing protein n=1 Tax=Apiospora saccharicola TaxID=335842 RepID=A0ABR1VRC7_9PEZI
MHFSPADYPQVWQKPTFEDLLTCLQKLKVDPPVWNPSSSRKIILRDHENSAAFRREVAAYLGTIISSSLKWIDDDGHKEVLWEEASRRLSERCGRAGMGEITRRWPFEDAAYPPFELTIREPPITGDALGLKTWGSSYVLAQQLSQIAAGPLSHLLSETATDASVNVLELGSGTGLLGMAAAAIWQTGVALSDLPNIVPNLAFNVGANRALIEARGGRAEADALTWGGSGEDDGQLFAKKNQFKIVLAADPLYDDDHPVLLTSVIQYHLARDSDARAVVMVPLRDAVTKNLLSTLRDLLSQGDDPVVCLEEDLLPCQDDWDENDESTQPECWWGIFRRLPIQY